MIPNSNSSTAGRLTIQCRKGDTFTRTFTFTDSTGAAINLAAKTIVLTVVNTAGSTVLTFSGSDIDATNAATGVIIIAKTAANMAVTAGEYRYDLQMTEGAVKTTYLHGAFIVDTDITS